MMHFLSKVINTTLVPELKRRNPKSYFVTCVGDCSRVEIWLSKNATNNSYRDDKDPKLFVSEDDKPMILENGTCSNCISKCDGYPTKPDCSNMSIAGNTFYLTINTFRPKENLALHSTNLLGILKYG